MTSAPTYPSFPAPRKKGNSKESAQLDTIITSRQHDHSRSLAMPQSTPSNGNSPPPTTLSISLTREELLAILKALFSSSSFVISHSQSAPFVTQPVSSQLLTKHSGSIQQNHL